MRFHGKHALATALVATLFGFSLAACEDHYTTQEAYDACNQLGDTNPGVLEPAAFDDCVDCYERCGADCEELGTAPETFACPDDTSTTEES
ncbi:MAG: hypothetical protein U0271_04615 [Polyangiaceae bacterium]